MVRSAVMTVWSRCDVWANFSACEGTWLMNVGTEESVAS